MMKNVARTSTSTHEHTLAHSHTDERFAHKCRKFDEIFSTNRLKCKVINKSNSEENRIRQNKDRKRINQKKKQQIKQQKPKKRSIQIAPTNEFHSKNRRSFKSRSIVFDSKFANKHERARTALEFLRLIERTGKE